LQVLPEAHLNLNQFVSSYSQQDGVVTIRTSTGKLIEGDALIGADGVRSAVRAQMLGDGPPRVTGHLAYRAMVHQANLPKRLRTSEVTAWMGPQLHAIQYPVRRGELQNLVVIVQGPAPEDLDHWDHSANLPDLLQHLQGACAYLQDLVQHVPDVGGEWRLWKWPTGSRCPQRLRWRRAL
jgi:salicylate hydroxylase